MSPSHVLSTCPPTLDTYMGVAGDHTWLCRAISAQKPTFWSPRSGPTTRLPEGALEAVTWLAGRGGCGQAPGELVQLVWAGRQEAHRVRGAGGWRAVLGRYYQLS